MSKLWATYGDAIKLILTGDTTKPLGADQQRLFVHMMAQGGRDEDGNDREHRELPGVRPQVRDAQRFYYIPDLVRFMLKEIQDKQMDIQAPPFDLDYLNSLGHEEGMLFFLFGAAPGARAWSDTAAGERHWELVCREIAIKQELAVLRGLHHAGDPLRLESVKRQTAELTGELESVRREMEALEEGQIQEEEIEEPCGSLEDGLSWPPAEPVPTQLWQEDEILRVIRDIGHDPLNLPPNFPGRPGIKAEVRKQLGASHWQGKRFDKAWERLRYSRRIVNRTE